MISQLSFGEHEGETLESNILVSYPGMEDQFFSRSVVLICSHGPKGAMGIMLNRPALQIERPFLFKQLGLLTEGHDPAQELPLTGMPIIIGGPVETSHGFVLHSPDYHVHGATVMIDEERVAMTSTLDVLHSAARGQGPSKLSLALGFAGWGAGQLDEELKENHWLICGLDEHLVFDTDFSSKYQRALSSIGVNPAHLIEDLGEA